MSDTSDFPTYEEQLEAERIREEERLAEHELHLAMREGGPRITSSLPASLVTETVSNLVVIGGGFVDGSEIEIDGQAQSTIFVDSNRLSAVGYTVPDIVGTVTITVRNPDSEESNDFSVMVKAPPPNPVITALTPNSVPIASGLTTVRITGTDFAPGIVVWMSWGGASKPATYIDANTCEVAIDFGYDVSEFGMSVENPVGDKSNEVMMPVTLKQATFTACEPASIPSPVDVPTPITLTGTNFNGHTATRIIEESGTPNYLLSEVSHTDTSMEALVNVAMPPGSYCFFIWYSNTQSPQSVPLLTVT